MKISLQVFAFAFLGILVIASCTTNPPGQDMQPSPPWVATQNAQDEYAKALGRWQSHNFANYEITVDAFSSMLAPPCSVKATLRVQDNKLLATTEIETPMSIPMPNDGILYNPECHEYENYLVTKQFETVENLLTGQLPHEWWKVKFDAEYGFVTELIYGGGESAKIIRYFGFKPR